MADVIYPKALKGFLDGNLTWAGTIKAVLVTSSYVYSANHEFLSNISAGYRVSTSLAFTGLATYDDGICDADDAVFQSVSGSNAPAVVVFKDTGNEATSRLIVYFDSLDGLPVVPAGTNIEIRWSNDTNRMFKI